VILNHYSIESTAISGYVLELIFTFFLGILIEGVSYFRYVFQAHAYAALAKQQNLKEG
jgi:hypothetical protein